MASKRMTVTGGTTQDVKVEAGAAGAAAAGTVEIDYNDDDEISDVLTAIETAKNAIFRDLS